MALPAGTHFGMDLVEQAAYHIAFLKAVNNNRELRKPEVLKRAIYRYEKFWLPLVAEYPTEYLSAPMDIEWIWHCHMLSAEAYEKDCYSTVGMTLNHTVLKPDAFQKSRNKANTYWSEKYSEPFYMDYSIEYDDKAVSNFSSGISYDILTAAEKQMSFLYQVSFPHYMDRKFLQSAFSRYKQFLLLKKQYPEECLVPCNDINLIWHTHRVNPLIYKNDTMRIVGQLPNDDDVVVERLEGSKLRTTEKRTRKLWKLAYNEPLSKCGTMYRGNPQGLYTINLKDEFSFCTKVCTLLLDQLTLHMPSPDLRESKHVGLKAGSSTASRTEVAKWFKLKRPANSRPGNPSITWSKIGSFKIDTSIEHGILFSIQQKSGLLGAKTDLDSNFLDIIPLIESPTNASKPGGVLKRRLTFKANATLDVYGHFQQPNLGDVILHLIEGSYNDGVIPDDIQRLCGPAALERLPPGSDYRCKVALHTLKNHLGQAAFQVRIFHSTSLMTSVVQVLYQNKVCSVAYLLTTDQLPQPTEVSSDLVTVEPGLGERAILIENDDGHWGIVSGHWAGLRNGVPPSEDHLGVHGSPGTLSIKFYKASTGEVVHAELPYLQRQYSISIESTQVDLKRGSMHISPESKEVAENICLVFSISLLHVLCVPRPKDWTEGERVSVPINQGALPIEAVPSDSLSCVKAAGLLIQTPSNDSIATTVGSRSWSASYEEHDDHTETEKECNNNFGIDSGRTGNTADVNEVDTARGECEGEITDDGGKGVHADDSSGDSDRDSGECEGEVSGDGGLDVSAEDSGGGGGSDGGSGEFERNFADDGALGVGGDGEVGESDGGNGNEDGDDDDAIMSTHL